MNRAFYYFSMIMTVVLLISLPIYTFAKETPSEAMVRVIHASPDAPAVDIFADGKLIVEDAEFKAATDYVKLPSGTYHLELYATGTKGEQDPVIQTELTFKPNQAYTVAAVNSLKNLELVVTEDDLSLIKGQTKIRTGHFSPDAPAVNVMLKNEEKLFENVSFKDVTNYLPIKAGTYDISIVAADNNKKLLDLSGTVLEPNAIYSVYAINSADKVEPLILVYQADMTTSAMLHTESENTSKPSSAPYIVASTVVAVITLLVVMNKRFHNR